MAALCPTLLRKELRNEAGNASCTSGTFNSSDEDLETCVCRLLPYENVFREEAPDVQSGFHKCWSEYQDDQDYVGP